MQELLDAPQYHAQTTFSLPVTSVPETLAVAVIFVPAWAFEVASSATVVTLTEPAAAMAFVARVVYVLSPNADATTHLTHLPS